MPALKQPYGVSEQKIACCGPCKSDPIVVNFHTKKSMNIIEYFILKYENKNKPPYQK